MQHDAMRDFQRALKTIAASHEPACLAAQNECKKKLRNVKAVVRKSQTTETNVKTVRR